MNNILSQSEIDELLNSLASGSSADSAGKAAEETKEARIYDFLTANRFPKDQMRTLNIVFQSFAQLLSNHLMSILRDSVDVEVMSVEEISFNEFNNSLPSPVVLAIIDMTPLDDSILMQMSTEVAYAIISHLFGGMSNNADPARSFTEIDLVIIERVLRQIMPIFRDAWLKVLEVNATLSRLETSSQFAQIAALNEPIALITLDVKIGDNTGIISLCIPHAAIEPVTKQLNTRLWYSGTQERSKQTVHGEILRKKLHDTPITLHAVFDETVAPVSEILKLQVGDVIQLNQNVNAPLTIRVQHIPKFKAQMGSSSSRYAVKIVDIISGEEE